MGHIGILFRDYMGLYRVIEGSSGLIPKIRNLDQCTTVRHPKP